ncbi:aminodeoxychorismate synthase component I [Vibrio sp. WJH972]
MINNKNLHLSIVEMEYQKDLATSLFDSLQSLDWSMLLHSAADDHVDNRYDIIVANPCATLTTFGEDTLIDISGDTQSSQTDPFELIAQLTAKFTPSASIDSEFPFTGGALGYFAYDLGRRVERIPTIAENDIDMPDMAIGIYTWAIVIDHQSKTAQLVGENLSNAKQFIDRHIQSNQEAIELEFALTSDWTSNMTPQSYQKKFAKIHHYLLSGDCYQVNLAQRFIANYHGSEWKAYQELATSNQAPFSAFLRLPQGAVLSVSPERFIGLNNRVIETKPIKGTRPRSDIPHLDEAHVEDLKNAKKDQAENLMIVDLLRNDIGRVALPGSVSVPSLFDIESFPAVHHLVSTIRAELAPSYQATDLLRACFPGGSITGAPKVRAMEIIEELEPHRRNVYCGSIGYICRNGRVDTSITIRTLVANKGRLYAWAGGGLVADSQVDAEYQETFDKLSRILPILSYGYQEKVGK